MEKQFEYIYLLREREFINANQPIYKIGRTSQEPGKRLGKYPKDSELIICIQVQDSKSSETKLIARFTEIFTKQSRIGAEYFSGSRNEMIKIIAEEGCFANSQPAEIPASIIKKVTAKDINNSIFSIVKDCIKIPEFKKRELKALKVTAIKESLDPENFKYIIKSKSINFIVTGYEIQQIREQIMPLKTVYEEYDLAMKTGDTKMLIEMLIHMNLVDAFIRDRPLYISYGERNETPKIYESNEYLWMYDNIFSTKSDRILFINPIHPFTIACMQLSNIPGDDIANELFYTKVNDKLGLLIYPSDLQYDKLVDHIIAQSANKRNICGILSGITSESSNRSNRSLAKKFIDAYIKTFARYLAVICVPSQDETKVLDIVSTYTGLQVYVGLLNDIDFTHEYNLYAVVELDNNTYIYLMTFDQKNKLTNTKLVSNIPFKILSCGKKSDLIA